MERKVTIMNPYGYCPGVNRALLMIEKINQTHSNKNVFCIGEPIHNSKTTNSLIEKGIGVKAKINIDSLESIKDSIVIFPAHGAENSLKEYAKVNNNEVYDCVCPIVDDVYHKIEKYNKENNMIIYIGDKNHQESKTATSLSSKIIVVESIKDLANIEYTLDGKYVVLNQTTFAEEQYIKIVNNIKKKIKNVVVEDCLCQYVIKKHRTFEKEISKDYDGIIIVGDTNSKNANVLYEKAKSTGVDTLFIVDICDQLEGFVKDKKDILIVSSSSSDGSTVESIASKIKKFS